MTSDTPSSLYHNVIFVNALLIIHTRSPHSWHKTKPKRNKQLGHEVFCHTANSCLDVKKLNNLNNVLSILLIRIQSLYDEVKLNVGQC